MTKLTGQTLDAAQLRADFRRYPIDEHGKLRFAYGKVTNDTAGALAANSTLGLVWLPPGRKRIIPHLSRISTSAFGAGRTLSVGHAAYAARPPSEAVEPLNATALVAALDVSAAVTAAVLGTALKYDMYSTEDVLLFGTVLGNTMPVAATVEVLVAYLYE